MAFQQAKRAASAPTSVDSGLGVATGDRQDGGAEGDGDPGGEDQGFGGGAENFAPRPVTVVNAAPAELGRNFNTESRLSGSRAPAMVGSTMTPPIRTPMALATLRSRIPQVVFEHALWTGALHHAVVVMTAPRGFRIDPPATAGRVGDPRRGRGHLTRRPSTGPGAR